MGSEPPVSSARRIELLHACYGYVLEHGLAGLSLRPLAAATGTSPRVLLYLFGTKDQLIREILARARREQVAQVATALAPGTGSSAFEVLVDRLWGWLSAPEQRPVVRLTYEAFLFSLGVAGRSQGGGTSHDPGPWLGFAAESARDWLALLVQAQPDTPHAVAEARATHALALIRGLLLDLLACDEPQRVAAAMEQGW